MTTPQQIFIEMVENNPIVVKMKDPLMVVYVVDGIGDRNNIDEKVRYEGMIVFVKENRSNYQLQWGTANTDWKVLLSSTDNSITDIELVDTDELEKTYRIHFTNGNHFDYVVKDGKDGEEAPEMKIEYSEDNINRHDVFTAWDKYIRFSTDWWNTYWAGFKFIGEDGQPGAPWQDWAPGQDGVSVVDVYVDWVDLVFKYSDDTTSKIEDFKDVFDIPTDLSELSDSTDILGWKQDKLTAGDKVEIVNNVIKATYQASDFDIKDLSDRDNLIDTWNNKQDELWYVPEDVDNKSTNIVTDKDSNTKYPSVKAIKTYVDNRVVDTVRRIGSWDASWWDFPAIWSGDDGKIKKWDTWVISVDGVLNWEKIHIWDWITANIDEPTVNDWDTLNKNIDYVPEDDANKEWDIETNKESTTKYPTIKGIYDWVVGKLKDKLSIGWDSKDSEIVVWTNDNQDFRIKTNDTNRVIVTKDGNIGIWTEISTQKLDVDGKIRMRTPTEDSDSGDIVATKWYLKNKVEKTWISLVSSWTAEPTIHSTENDYDVWEYTYWTTKLYRTVYKTYTAWTDIFYSEASLENVVASRALNF